MSKVSIIMPVYNCKYIIVESIKSLINIIEQITYDYEIIVVDDGSIDNTYITARDHFKSNNKIKVISYYPNIGKGYAVKRGILEAEGDKIIFIDGDMEIDAKIISKYIDALDYNDIVIASKYHPNSKVTTPLSRRILSRAFNALIKLLLNIEVSDTQAGLKAGRREVFKSIFKAVLVKRYAFDVEMLTIATLLDCKIVEMPVDINLDKRFKVREIIRMFVDIAGIVYRLRVIRWYDKNLNEDDPRYKPILPI